MTSMAKDLMSTYIGLTPQTCDVSGTVLVSVTVAEIDLKWQDWATTIWQNVESLKWGA